MPDMTERFVILEHRGQGAVHWDFMFECGDALATWQVECDPYGMAVGEEAPARRLGDHRLHYLTYEGAVSGGRGNVRRVASGLYELIERRGGLWRVDLKEGWRGEGGSSGGAATYELVLTSPGGTGWTLKRLREFCP